MKVIFAHGKESGPQGNKASYLREHFDAITPDLYRRPLNEQAEILVKLIKENQDCLLVGSSMGGAAATLASKEVRPSKMLLLAPALHYEEYDLEVPSDIETVYIHGLNDDIIPYSISENMAKKNNSEIHLVNDNHRLSDSKDLIIDTIKKLIV